MVIRGRLPIETIEVAPKSEPRLRALRAEVLSEFRRFGIVDDGFHTVNPNRYDGTKTTVG